MDEKGNLHKTVLNTLLLNPFCIRIIFLTLTELCTTHMEEWYQHLFWPLKIKA